MPSKKRQSKNAFSFFLDEEVVRLRREGKDIKGKNEAVPFAQERWQNMSSQKKAPYEERARDAKRNKDGIFRHGRLDCTGNRIDDRIDMDKVMVDERKRQKKHLLNHWQRMKAEEVVEDKFYIISFQSYFEFPNEEGYQPCELAVVEYSLKHGISEEFHVMINSGSIKLGLGAEAKIYCDKYHKIPPYGFELGRTDHLAVWCELLDFVNPDGNTEFPPLFSKLHEHRKNVACLEYLAGLCGKSNRLSKIFLWENLVLSLYENAGVTAPSMNVIEDGGNSSMYDFERGTKCDYHEELECIYCSMLNVKKCCFWISDAFTNIYKYDITENHLPVRQAPQYSVIRAEDIILNSNMKRRFIGADAMPPYDPNLPAGLQRESLRELLSESSVNEDGVYVSRDIRYRKKAQNHPNVGAGRGMVLASLGNVISRSRDDAQSIAETIDDVASAILEDDNLSVMADDERSVDLRSEASAIPFTANTSQMHQRLPGNGGISQENVPSLSRNLDRINLKDTAITRQNRSPVDSSSTEMKVEYVSDSSTAEDVSEKDSPYVKKFGNLRRKQQSTISTALAAGDAARYSSGTESKVVNDRGKHFAHSKIGVFALARKPAYSNTPLCLGRGRFLQKNVTVDSASTYQSDSE